MSRFDAIDLSALPPPDVIEPIHYEDILAEMKETVAGAFPAIAPVLETESEPAVKVLQVCAFYIMLARARVNDAGRAVMLAFATGTDLDHLGALLGVARAVIDEGDPEANPPVPPTLEEDDRFRGRIQLALEGFSTAGPVGAYLFHSLSASPQVRDVSVISPEPGEVRITVLAVGGDGTPDQELLDTVEAALNADNVRPLTDLVVVQAATIVPYAIEAELDVKIGPDPAVVLAEAEAAVAAYVAGQRRLGAPIARSGLFAALHREGVRSVALTAPAADVAIEPTEAAHCTAITVTVAGEGA